MDGVERGPGSVRPAAPTFRQRRSCCASYARAASRTRRCTAEQRFMNMIKGELAVPNGDEQLDGTLIDRAGTWCRLRPWRG